MRLAEGHALLGQVVGNIRGSGEALACLRKHGAGVHGHGLEHPGGNRHAVEQGLGRIGRALFALLEVLVVGKRERLHGGEQRHEVTVDTAGLAARKLGKVWVLLLRHDGRAGGVAVRERDEAKLRAAPQDDLLAQAREVHHAYGAGVVEVEQVVAVRDGVHRVGNRMVKAQEPGSVVAVERIGGASKRSRSQRVGVGCSASSDKTCVVAREHPEVRQHVVREEHWLRVLQVRVPRHHHAQVLLGNAQ